MGAYTSEQVATLLNVSDQTVRKLAREGKLDGFKIGKDWRFTQADIDAFIERQRPARKPETTQ